jgi:AcrR family transcriptional regulator
MALDAEQVVAAGGRLADRVGFERLTIQRLARALRIKPPSLYNHVDGLDHLRREIAELGARELRARLAAALVGRSGALAIRALAIAYRAFAREHPGLYEAAQRARGPDASAIVEMVTAVVPDVHAVRAVRAALHGFVVLEHNEGFGLPQSIDDSFAKLVDILIAGLA